MRSTIACSLAAALLAASAPALADPTAAERAMAEGLFREGKKLLADRSPATHAGAVVKPLLVAQGKDDPRVRENETAALVTALKSKGVPVTYVVEIPGRAALLATMLCAPIAKLTSAMQSGTTKGA